jgi:hypothetical protein
MIEILGLNNKYHTFNYDENGFLMASENVYNDTMIEFNTFIDDEGNEKNADDTLFFSYKLVRKSDNKYIYDITIIEETLNNDNHAYGMVEIYYSKKNSHPNNSEDERQSIDKIIVNNVENGFLRDKYNDCFNIKPDDYMSIIYSNYIHSTNQEE